MKIRKEYKLDKLAAEQDGFRPMRHLMLDVEKKRLVVTNGHALVSVPVVIQEGDTSGMIAVDAVKEAQKKAKKDHMQKSQDYQHAVGELSCGETELTAKDGPTFKRPLPSDCPDSSKPKWEQGNYPQYEQVMVTHDPKDSDVVELGFNAKLLMEMAKAMGASGAHMGVKLRFKIHTDKKTGEVTCPHDPIQVFIASKNGEEPEGILMPIRL